MTPTPCYPLVPEAGGLGENHSGALDVGKPPAQYPAMITRTVRLPLALDARLRRRARAQKLTYSEAVRRALQEGLCVEPGVNMLAALGEFAGSVEGPADLSTNKAYLDDYGIGRRKR